MSNAVRVSTAMMESARVQGVRAGRSIAQQLEYWARIGRAMENAPGMSVARIRSMLDGKIGYDDLNGDEQLAAREDLAHQITQLKPGKGLQQELIASGLPYSGVDDRGRLVRVTPRPARATR